MRLPDQLIGSDPGLLRLHSAARTTVTLVVVLAILYAFTAATHQPVTVAMIGVVVAMQAAMGVNEPDPRRARATIMMIPLAAGAALSTGAALAAHPTVAEVIFVGVIFVAVYLRRFGNRGLALGMAGFMSYFFALFLQVKPAQLPMLIGAILIGTLCCLVIRQLMPDNPQRTLRYTVQALWVRLRAVVTFGQKCVHDNMFDDAREIQMRRRVAQLNETVVMIEDQITTNTTRLWPGVDKDALVLRLVNNELAAQRVAGACDRAARVGLAEPVHRNLVTALRCLTDIENHSQAIELSNHVLETAEQPEARGLAMAIIGMTSAAAPTRALLQSADPTAALASSAPKPDKETAKAPDTEPDTDRDKEIDLDITPKDEPAVGLLPTTRTAIQASIAGALAIIAGEMTSPARWYWAVITAFVVFAGATSRGDVLTRGWQRLVGTLAGVPAGMLIATAVSGHWFIALVLIFGCLFTGFLFMKVSYSVMSFCITTMLALLYGLLGEFSAGVLMLRIEETAIGSIIGISVATLVLPTKTVESVRRAITTFLENLSEVIGAATARDSDSAAVTAAARAMHRQLNEIRVSARPLTRGLSGIGGRGSIRQVLRQLSLCDYHARILAQSSGTGQRDFGDHITRAATRIQQNIEDLVASQGSARLELNAATEYLDAAESAGAPERTVRALRSIDLTVINLSVV